MTKLSFKAVLAAIVTTGLVFAGFLGAVAPAQAAGSGTLSWTSGSAPAVTHSTNQLPALNLTFVPSSANLTSAFEYINISLVNSSGQAVGTTSIPGSSSSAAGCKMTGNGLGSISGAHITHNSFNCSVLMGDIQRFFVGVGSYGAFDLKLDAGLVQFLTTGSYYIKVTTEYPNSPILDEAVIPFVIPQAPSVSASPSSVSATVGTAFTQSVTYTPTNFSGPFTYSTNNNYGIQVNSATGALSGTPTLSTMFSTPIMITVTGANNATVITSVMFNIASGSVTPPPPSGGGGVNCSIGSGNYLFQTRGNNGVTVSSATNCGYLNMTTSAVLPANNFVRSGYTFTGWNTSADGTGTTYAPGASITVTRDIRVNGAPTQSFYAQWSANSGNGSGNSVSARPTASLGLNLSRGARVAQAPAPVSASGLLANAPYTVEVHSTPVVIASGTVASDGSVNYTASIPANLEAGWHTMIFSSTAADGTSFTSNFYFKVAGDGTLLSTSETVPAELAYTGSDSENMSLFLLGGLSLALIGAEMIMIARRKRSN
ncbi:MAG: hypothetical protein RI926_558 [Actinomycetota bacterium]|jgi:uncharacterized repeat protein (TIGR02543 family)